VFRAGIIDILGLVNIVDITDVAMYIMDIATDIADIAMDIADIVDRCGYCRLNVVNVVVETSRHVKSVMGVSRDSC
jgi:hypothetical protein